MRRDLHILAGTVLFGVLWAAGSRVPEAMAAMETFRVADVEVRGNRYLDAAEVEALLRLADDASIWEDVDELERRVAAYPLVLEATVRRRLPATFTVNVVERVPVALVATPTYEAVDAEGVRLPIDPARFRLDLPVLEPPRRVAPGATFVPAETRRLASVVSRLTARDTAFLQRVSEVSWLDDATIRARWIEPRVDFLLPPDATARRFREGLAALAHAVGGGHSPAVVDLRFADQVVVRGIH